MNELYSECGVKRKATIKTLLMKIGLVIVCFISLIISMTIPLIAIVAAIFVIATIYLFPMLNVEFEYIFCDGQIDFDKIMGNSRRKTVLKIDMEQVEKVAPVKSHELDSYQNLKIRDFTSCSESKNIYAIICSIQDKGLIKILFEPSQEMISCMKQKAPRKIFID